MKTSYLSLTFLIAFLPILTPTFNTINVEGKNETLNSTLTDPVNPTPHVHHAGCFFQHHHSSKSENAPIQFGAELGKFIRTERLKDANYRIKKVVIDPGHGGKDPGCSGRGSQEKQIALAIGLQLGRTLQNHFPDIQFIFTRQTDVFVPLDRRAKIANEHKADLFISIHCNYFPSSENVKGSETYVLGLHRAEDNLEVAKRENSAIYYEENYQQTYNGYDPNSPEGHIILSMYQNAFLEQSILFANKIEKNIKQNTQHKSRGVRQAGFLVLRETTMPSVLVETGYLSNAKDNNFLSTSNGKSQVVNSIAQAFSEYKREVENQSSIATQEIVYTTTQNNRKAQTFVKPIPTQQSKAYVKPAQVQQPKTYIPPPSKKIAKSGYNTSVNQSLNQPLIISSAPKKAKEAPPIVTREAPIKYKVLLTSSEKLIDTKLKPWTELPYTVQIIQDGAIFKYIATGFSSFEEAVSAKSSLRKHGFKEAFLVAYQNGKRIDMKVAMSKTGIGKKR